MKTLNLLKFGCFLALISIGITGCGSTMMTTRSKTQELEINQLDGIVHVSSLQYAGNFVQLSQDHIICLYDEDMQLAILSIQIQNTVKRKYYDLSAIILSDGYNIYKPEHVKYFRGNSVIGFDWGIISRSDYDEELLFSANHYGTYTINLIYAIDAFATIKNAVLFGQKVEFEEEFALLNVLDMFHH